MSSQRLPVYLINIDRARDRLEEVTRQADEVGIKLTRVEGVDGSLIARADWVDVDHKRFERRHGRVILCGEYGCYRSHLKALRTFVESNEQLAVIIEDDISLNADFLARAWAAKDAVPQADIIKLVNHRWKGFRFYTESEAGDQIGRCLFGPQGSTACYLVTRAGAEKLLSSLATMSLPWDVAIERGWDSRISVYATARNLVKFGPHQKNTMIGWRRDYLAAKLEWSRRFPTYLFRSADFIRRIAYVMEGLVSVRHPNLKPPPSSKFG